MIMEPPPQVLHPDHLARSALPRDKPSRGARIIVREERPPIEVLDYGCGYGYDTEWLAERGFLSQGYDPGWICGDPHVRHWPVILCSHVLDILPGLGARIRLLRDLQALLLPYGRIYLVTRTDSVAVEATKRGWLPYSDGWIDDRGSFRRGYTSENLVAVTEALGFTCEVIPIRYPTAVRLTIPVPEPAPEGGKKPLNLTAW